MNCKIVKLLFGKNREYGLTLLELIIVSLMLGILTAVSLLNFTKQVGKARESEMKNAVGTIARSQIAYHWEIGEFCCTGLTPDEILVGIGVSISSKYIDSWQFDTTAVADTITFRPVNNNWDNDITRAYSGGVFFGGSTSDGYQKILCQSYDFSLDTDYPTLTSPVCGGDAVQLK